MDSENRVVVLIDMDCFYCQVEEKLNPDLKGKPIAVVQYNPWKGGGIIAVNYVARAMGVTRHMRGDEAKEKCPEIQLPSVPCQRGKADITKYRDAGKDVARVLQKYTSLLERASIDEAYLDITASVQERLRSLNIHSVTSNMMPNTFALGYESIQELVSDVHNYGGDCMEFDQEHASRLLVGAVIVSEIRAAVYEETGYQCSAGIAHNKILAKLVCGMNKPNKQTVLPKHSINLLYKTLSIKKVKHLGGKFGDIVCETLKIKLMAELQKYTEKELQSRFDEKNGTWLYNIARGIDLEPVQARFNPKSIGCCKQFRGKSALTTLESLKKWLKDLGDEIEDRLEKDAVENNRCPKQMVVSFSTQMLDGRDTSSSRSYNFGVEDELCGELFSAKALELLLDSAEGCKPRDDEADRKLKAPIKFLGISVGKFEDNDNKKTKKIKDYFSAGTSKGTSDVKENIKPIGHTSERTTNDKIAVGKEYIINKFFQQSEEKLKSNKELSNTEKPILESSLDKQESFFAKFLNNTSKEMDVKNKIDRSTTPVCHVVTRGNETSNDTDYSGSTIDDEINKSVAMFEENPEDVDRVSDMRKLLNSTILQNEEIRDSFHESENKNPNHKNVPDNNNVETIQCSDCGKCITLNMFDIHADYHLALKLREEERQQLRKEKEKTNTVVDKTKKPEEKTKKQDIPKIEVKSIANFFVKVDDSAPSKMCSECGKKVPIEKFVEHLDFHEAQKLSREINRPVTTSNSREFIGPVTNTNSRPETNSAKRKRKSTSPIKKPKVQCKSIDLFFRQ
ncbi:DNA polymerase eta [Zerene cesonia]|uniref:DNA polymerase eta n=1 Tax=Zerene cesonia TaxID=33412 RepID=UPI0018E51958|nr:DNA polymerase eta [Zerene cesonia]